MNNTSDSSTQMMFPIIFKRVSRLGNNEKILKIIFQLRAYISRASYSTV